MAVSGAAISPNAGAFSTPLRTFLLTLFNARLGWWLGHPEEPKAVGVSGPPFAVKPMLRELLGRTDDRKPWLFVSDGGIASGTTSWSIDAIELSLGDNTVTDIATDKAGNNTTLSLTVTYDPNFKPPLAIRKRPR